MRSFFDFFPTPKFLEMPSPGLALNDDGLKFIEFGTESHGVSVKRFGSANLPAGLVESGVIQDQEAFVHALQNFRKSFNLRYIRTTLPEERAYLFQTTISNVSEKELRTAVEFTIEENVPLSVSESVFDFTVLPKTDDTPRDQLKVSVSVIAEAVVLEYLSLFRAAGFMPLHFDVESQAVTKAVVSSNEKDVMLIVNLNRTKVGLYIVSRGAVDFSSTVSIPPIVEASTSELLALPSIVSEIKKVFLYWQTQGERTNQQVSPIGKVVLCGSEAARVGLAQTLSAELSLPVELGNVWGNVFSFDQYIPDIPFKDSLSYAAAIGLALPHKHS